MRRRSREARRSAFMLVGGALLSLIILGAWFPANALFHQRSNLATANAALSQLHQQDAALAQARKDLSDSSEIARIAREQYQLVNPGQQAYEVLPPTSSVQVGHDLCRRSRAERPGRPLVGVGPPPGFGVRHHADRLAGASGRVARRPVSATHGTAARGFVARVLSSLEFLALKTGERPHRGAAASPADVEAVTALLGRVPNGEFVVVVRRRDGRPAVIANDPHLRDGAPMPTRFWLVDPEIRALVGRLESRGGVRRAESDIGPELLQEAHARYARGA